MFKHKNVDTTKQYLYSGLAKELDMLCENCFHPLGAHSSFDWACPSPLAECQFEETASISHAAAAEPPRETVPEIATRIARTEETLRSRRVGGTDTQPEYAVSFGTKDTNPKDAIGSKKAPMSALPASVIAEMGVAMLEGKAKYGAFNYRVAGVRASVYYDAACRHLFSWWEGEDIDPDSGMPHITKLLTCMVVLRDAQRNGMVTDDRPPISPVGYADLNAKAAAIIEMHKDKTPRHYTRDDKIGGGT